MIPVGNELDIKSAGRGIKFIGQHSRMQPRSTRHLALIAKTYNRDGSFLAGIHPFKADLREDVLACQTSTATTISSAINC